MDIYLDMDGTIADLYGAENWLDRILAEDITVFRDAAPLCNMTELAELLHVAQTNGWRVGIISWTPLNASKKYKDRVRQIKLRWLKKHLPTVQFDNIHIIEYGTPKSKYNRFGQTAVLIDDNAEVLDSWNGKTHLVENPQNIPSFLQSIVE